MAASGSRRYASRMMVLRRGALLGALSGAGAVCAALQAVAGPVIALLAGS
jgi:hypothetical protein